MVDPDHTAPDVKLEEVCPAPFSEWACCLTKGHAGPCQDADPAWFRAWRRAVDRQRALNEKS
jgi:hypothetical protein